MKDCNNCKHMGKYDKCFACIGVANGGECQPTMWEEKEDKVNHPSHYNHGKYECIDVMEDVFGKVAVSNFCLLNAFKYLWRSKHKNGAEDIRKAIFYLEKHLELGGDTDGCDRG